MYETESNAIEEQLQLPAAVDEALRLGLKQVSLRTTLPWSEHCTECAAPSCYSSCDLYQPRADGRCRRFLDGMVRVPCPSAHNGYLLKIRFKRWGKLWTPGTTALHTTAEARKCERADARIGALIRILPLPGTLKGRLQIHRYCNKKEAVRPALALAPLPDCFLLECYNPHPLPVPLLLTIRQQSGSALAPFQQRIELTPGLNRTRIRCREIARQVNLGRPFEMEIFPDNDPEDMVLYFGLMEFVTETAAEAAQKTDPTAEAKTDQKNDSGRVKCVIWDLDNTLWEGTLVEDGLENLRLKPRVVDLLHTLDERGILLSIASKNNRDEALAALGHFGLDELFLYPQISWSSKSQAIDTIARSLNIGRNALLFLDDTAFEREEVRSLYPEVRTLDAADYLTLPERTDCQAAVTDESRHRRQLYRVEMDRHAEAESYAGDTTAFLRACHIRLTVTRLTAAILERAHELTQRTNQMNFSGTRYSRELLGELLNNPDVDLMVLSCEDRFGHYGTIGFSVIERHEPRMIDLMFSCRIQGKRVEHAFLAYAIARYRTLNGGDFHVNYRPTSRNAPSAQVFADIGMIEERSADGLLSLCFAASRPIPDDGIVELVDAYGPPAE